MSAASSNQTASKQQQQPKQQNDGDTGHEKEFVYQFDPVIAQEVGAVEGSALKTGHVGTQNNRGFQMSTLSPLYQQWIHAGKALNYSHPIIDIGCAFGLNMLTATFRDGVPHVIGVDMTQSHLDYIKRAYNEYVQQGFGKKEQKIEIFQGLLPNLECVKDNSVSSILCAEVIHFLTGEELPIAFKRFYDILVPGGQLQLTCASIDSSTSGFSTREYINYKKKQDPNNQWPGFIDGAELKQMIEKHKSQWKDIYEDVDAISIPSRIHLFAAHQIAKLADDAGFIVKSVQTTSHPGHPSVVKSEYSSVQLIAIKR